MGHTGQASRGMVAGSLLISFSTGDDNLTTALDLLTEENSMQLVRNRLVALNTRWFLER